MSLKLVPPREGRSRHWRIRGTIKGQYIDESTGVSSQTRAEEIRIKRENEILDQAIFGAKATTTFAVAAVSYLESRQPKGMQRYAIAGWNENSPCLIKDFGETLVNKIDQAKVNEVIAKRFQGKKPGTIVRNFLTPLMAVLHHAGKQGWCDIPRPFTRPKFKDARTRWARYEEADRILQNSAPHARPLFLFLMLTGCRISEAINLKWRDVDLAARWLVLRDTKNGTDRGVPIHRQLVEVLAGLPSAATKQGPVFLTDRGNPYKDRNREEGGQCRSAWTLGCQRAGIEDLHQHDLRHTFATWGLIEGMSDRVKKEIMGHSSSEMSDRYAHVPLQEAIAAIDLIPPRWYEKETQQAWRSRCQPKTKRPSKDPAPLPIEEAPTATT
jgi:integrase